MSRGRNKDGLFIDTGLLRDHVSKLRQQKIIASELYDNVKAMQNLSDPTVSYQYDFILKDIERLIVYFDRMAKSLRHISDEATYLSHKIEDKIVDDIVETRRKSSDTFI